MKSMKPYSHFHFFLCFRSYAEREGSDYLFVVDAEAHIDNPATLIRLLEQNRYSQIKSHSTQASSVHQINCS